MGTRSLTVINDEDGKEIVVMYRHWDGYPEGHGAELKAFLEPIKIVNGLSEDTGNLANGAGCLAAQIVTHFKGDSAGNIYLYPAGTRDFWEEYVYIVQPNVDGTINLVVEGDKVLYNGLVSEFDPENCE